MSGSIDTSDILVVIDNGDQYSVSLQPPDSYGISIQSGDTYVVNIDLPTVITSTQTGTYFRVADYAVSASYISGSQNSWDGILGKPTGLLSSSTQINELSNVSASFATTSSYALNAGAGSGFPFSGSAVITGSLLVSGGNIIGTSSLTREILGGRQRYIPLWTGSSSNELTSSIMYQTTKGIFIGYDTNPHFHSVEGETLAVHSGETGVKNVIYAHGTFNDDYRINLRNISSGSSASANFKATSDVGNDVGGYVQMGINSSTYSRTDQLGGPLDAYLYTTGSDLLIGTLSPDKRIILFTGPGNAQDNARVYIDASGSVAINTSAPTSGNPEALLVSAITDSYNLITAIANIDNYSQINIKNLSGGNSASADVVATNNIGTETSYYIDMGINSDQYNQPGVVGGPNDAYIYSTGNMLHIGNATAGQHIMFFAGGIDAEANNKLTLDASNQHTLSGSLNVTGSVNVLNGVVNNLTASYALTASYVFGALGTWDDLLNKPANLVSSSQQVKNFLPDGTVSSSQQATSWTVLSASFASTASNLNFTPATASFATSASYAPTNAGIVSSSTQINYTQLQNIPSGMVSSSTQVATLLPVGTVSSSVQINTGSFTGSFTGTLIGTSSWATSASYILPSGLPTGTVSSSTQVLYTGLSNIPANIVSSSTQIVAFGFATTGSNSFNGNQTITGSLIQGLEGNIASGENSHAEGSITKAIGNYSHAEGDNTQAKGDYSHAEGQETIASGSYSHAEGYQTIALANHQHVQGQYNAVSSVPAAFIVGNGTDDNNRSNLIFAAGNEVQITGSLKVTTGITGSLFGTSSQAVTASHVLPTGLPSGIISSSTQIATSLPSGVVSSSVQINTGSFSGSFVGTFTGTSSFTISSSNAITASYVLPSGLPTSVISSSTQVVAALPTGTVSSSLQINTGSFSGSLTGTLIGTSSWATSASFAVTASAATSITFIPSTASFATSASFAPTNVGVVSSSTQIDYTQIQNKPTTIATASFVEYANVANKPSLVSASSQIQLNAITGATFSNASFLFPNDLRVDGTLTAQEIRTEFVTSSVIFESGSTKFGDSADDTHQFTGSLTVLGTISGSLVLPQGIVSSSTQATSWTVATASFVEFTNIANRPTLISSSTQVNYVQLQNIPSGIVSSSVQINTGSFSGSITSASFATSASYAPTILPAGIVSSSEQINTGSFTGSFTGTLFGTSSWAVSSSIATTSIITASVSNTTITFTKGDGTQFPITVSQSGSIESASFATTAATASYIQYSNIDNLPTLVSSSTQVDYTQLQNIPTGIVSSSTQVISLLPNGTVSSSIQINTGSFSGSFTGNFIGTSSQANNSTSASFATSASYAPTILPSGIVSSSTQVDYTQLQNIPTGIVSSSTQINTGSFSGSFTGNFIGTSSWASNAVSSSFATTASAATSITFIPSTASFAASASFAPTILPSGVISSSIQVSYTGLSGIPVNIVSSSDQVTAFLPSGTVSSSTQINTGSFSGSFVGVLIGTSSWAQNAVTASVATSASFAPTILPAGIVSSSTQINTGSFTGSFTGTLIGTSSWASNAISSSFAITASAATSITFTPSTASFATSASAATSITFTPATASYALTASFIDGGFY